MASEKDGQLVRFICDICDEEWEVQCHSFKDAWEAARDDGWCCWMDETGEWNHRCPDCRWKEQP